MTETTAIKLISLLSVLQIASAVHIKFLDCGSKATINYVDISPCRRSPCKLAQGQNYTAVINFTPHEDSNTLVNKVCGKLGPTCINFPLPGADLCSNGITCPIQAGVEQSVTVTLPILKVYPKIKITAKWEIKGDNDDVVCFMMPIKIVDGSMTQRLMFEDEVLEDVFQRL